MLPIYVSCNTCKDKIISTDMSTLAVLDLDQPQSCCMDFILLQQNNEKPSTLEEVPHGPVFCQYSDGIILCSSQYEKCFLATETVLTQLSCFRMSASSSKSFIKLLYVF